MAGAPFSNQPIDLGATLLAPLDAAEAPLLAEACAHMEPWARMKYPADALTLFLMRDDPAAPVRAVWREGILAGAAVVRYPWLKGPYLEFLAVLPPWQGQGIGAAVLDWMEAELSATDRNLWVLVSDFNDGALRFYARHGFQPVAPLPNVAADGFTEILLRKRLTPPAA